MTKQSEAEKAAEDNARTTWEPYTSDQTKRESVTDFLAGVAWARANPEWVACSERMPPEYKTVLVMLLGNEIPAYGFRFGHGSTLWGVCDDAGDFTQYLAHQVTHWMPLPPAPEGE